jgi:hypothetical protein
MIELGKHDTSGPTSSQVRNVRLVTIEEFKGVIGPYIQPSEILKTLVGVTVPELLSLKTAENSGGYAVWDKESLKTKVYQDLRSLSPWRMNYNDYVYSMVTRLKVEGTIDDLLLDLHQTCSDINDALGRVRDISSTPVEFIIAGVGGHPTTWPVKPAPHSYIGIWVGFPAPKKGQGL